MVAHTSNPSIEETEAEGLLQVLYQPAGETLSHKTKIEEEETSNEACEVGAYPAWGQSSVLQSCHSVEPGTQYPWSLGWHFL